MFDWFWNFLYSISEILFELIDTLLVIANKLCGIEPVTIDGKESNFMIELLEDSRVFMGFAGAAIVGIFLLMIFSIVAICKNCKDGKKSNGRIAIEVFKTLGLFFLVPTLMVGFTLLLNQIVSILYKGTASGSVSLGSFLFENFCPDGMRGFEGGYDYTSTTSVRNYLSAAGYDLSDFRFFFSWIVSLPILFFVAKALLLFVERCISIVLLFIMSPISLSTTVVDDGAKFKLWRDKVLTKFLSGYGMIIGLNIYTIVLSFITRSTVEFGSDVLFISGNLVSFILRICFAIGGAMFLPKIFSMVGDLFVKGSAEEFNAASNATSGTVKTLGAVKKALFDKDEKKEKEKERDEADARRMRNLANGGGRGGYGGYGGYGDMYGSGNGNHSSTLGRIYETGKKVAKAILGIPQNQDQQYNNNNAGGDNSFNDSNKNQGKKTGFEKAVDYGKTLIETGAKVATAIGNQGETNMK